VALTLHTGRAAGQGEAATAVLVDGERIAAVGGAEELRAAHPAARLRAWPGELRPGLVWSGRPLPEAPSPRERVHAALREGATAIEGAALAGDPALLAAARRSAVALVEAPFAEPRLTPGARADLVVLDGNDRCVATIVGGRVLYRRA